ncbi:MAG: hypothetical protein AAF570_15575, partial [Bacteroidota bacterium]
MEKRAAIILRCKPHNPIHLGASSLDDSDLVIHSDTHFSAIINNYVKMFGTDGLAELKTLFDGGKVRISSAFPCLERMGLQGGKAIPDPQKRVFTLPRPENFALFPPVESDDHKAMKKVAFISENLWENYRNTDIWKSSAMVGGLMVLSEKECRKLGLPRQRDRLRNLHFLRKSSRPKVNVRKRNDSDAYFVLTTAEPQRIVLDQRRR